MHRLFHRKPDHLCVGRCFCRRGVFLIGLEVVNFAIGASVGMLNCKIMFTLFRERRQEFLPERPLPPRFRV